eukprot:g8092.t1
MLWILSILKLSECLQFGRWQEIATNNSQPQGRYMGYALAANTTRAYLYGGKGGSSVSLWYCDTWLYDFTTNMWQNVTQSSTVNPGRRYGHILQKFGENVYLFGGRQALESGSVVYMNDTWVLNIRSLQWTELTTLGDNMILAGRYEASAITFFDRKKMYVFGGYNGERKSDLWYLDLVNLTWSNVVYEGTSSDGTAPCGRSGHRTAISNDKTGFYMFGGYCTGFMKDLWLYNLTSNFWKRFNYGNNIPPRGGHGMNIYNDLIYIFGGSNSDTHLNDLWSIDIYNNETKIHNVANKPSGRRLFEPVIVGNILFIFGGYSTSGTNYLNEIWTLDLMSLCQITASGNVHITRDCVMYYEIVVTGKLNVTGIPDANGVLPKIIGGGSNRLFKVESGGQLVVKYLNLTGGDAQSSNGGAVYVTGSSTTLQVFQSFISHNRALDGGGVYVESGASFNATDSYLNSNMAYNTGGALRCYGAGAVCTLIRVQINNNKAQNNAGGGIAVVVGPSLTILNSYIQNNVAGRNGGGLRCYGQPGSDTSCTIKGSVITNNEHGSGYAGGGVICINQVSCTITEESVIASNTGNTPGLYCTGGATCSTDGTSYITLPCLPGTYGTKTPTTVMTSSNWATQPSSTGACTSCPAGKFGKLINQGKQAKNRLASQTGQIA